VNKLEALLQQGLVDGVYPLARLEVFHRNHHVISMGNAPEACVFDVASLTKVMSTTALVLEQQLSLDSVVQQWLPSAVAQVTLADLLFHRSGLPAFVPFFESVFNQHPQLMSGLEMSLREQTRRDVLNRVMRTQPVGRAGAQAIYSDVGFMLLGAVLEEASGMPLDALFTSRIAGPLGLSAGYRRISGALPLPQAYAPTGATRPREPAPGQEGMWTMLQEQSSALGEVDDDNAYCLDGVSGHAGLFSTALDVARFGQSLLADGRAWGPDALTPHSTRALGFDTPSREGASCGARFGRNGPRGAIGHLGFTGTSLWVDLDLQVVVAFLTNRVAFGRANVRIREFRPRVHDAVLDALKLV
jgi:CubicO group peptidase (beta-lactamase class C family)